MRKAAASDLEQLTMHFTERQHGVSPDGKVKTGHLQWGLSRGFVCPEQVLFSTGPIKRLDWILQKMKLEHSFFAALGVLA